MSNREKLADAGYEAVVVFDTPDYDEALIGITEDDGAVYDLDLMIAHLVRTEGMDELEALDFIEYNTIRALPYVENAPVIIRRLESIYG